MWVSEMYEESWKVRFSECDNERKLTLDGIVNYFQDCSNLQSESMNVGFDYLKNKKRAWMMDFWQIVIKRRPESFELVKVATWATGFKGFFGMRNFLMRDTEDKVLVCANSYWIYLDTATGHPIRVPQEEADIYSPEEPFDMEYTGRKLEAPEDVELVDTIVVKQHHLDVYNHMNNGKYIQVASDYVENHNAVWQVCCQYKKQARVNDIIKVYRKKEQNKIIIVLKDTDDSIYTTISFDLE